MRVRLTWFTMGLLALGGFPAGCTSPCDAGQVSTDNGCAMSCNSNTDCTQREVCTGGACVPGDRFASASSSSSGGGFSRPPGSSSSNDGVTSGGSGSSSGGSAPASSAGVSSSSLTSSSRASSVGSTSSSIGVTSASGATSTGSASSSGGSGPLASSGPSSGVPAGSSSSSAAASSSSGAPLPAELEPNNTDATAQPFPATGTIAGTIPMSAPAMADKDVFSVLVAMDGMALRAAVLNAAGNCNGLGDPFLRLRDEAGVELTADDDGSGTLCPLLEPRRNVRLRNLTAGTYYVEVTALGAGQAVPNYQLSITLIAGGCPNTLVDGAETCDDGNTTPGDGCNGACQLELPVTPEVEPNDTVGSATPLSGGSVGWRGAFPTTADVDWFELGLTQPSNLAVEVGDGLGGCLMRGNATVFNADGGQLGQGAGDCPVVDPRFQPQLQLVSPGTYRIRVRTNDPAVPTYVARVRATPRTCGDLLSQVPEECDDGNAATGDGCNPTCALEGIAVAEAEPNNTAAAPQAWNGQRLRANHASAPDDVDVFALDVTLADATVVVTLDDGLGRCPSGYKDLSVVDAAGMVLTGAMGVVPPALGCVMLDGRRQAQLRNIPVGPLLVRVAPVGPDPLSTYVLTTQVIAPVCGDGVLHPGRQEACDDGNTAAGDTCSGTCLWTVPAELEPNSDVTAANNLPALPAQTMGHIFPISDVDWFAFDHPGGPLKLQTTGAAGAACPGDTILSLWAAMGTAPIVENDDSLGGLCSLIDGGGATPVTPEAANLPGGRYMVQVRPFSPAEILGYQLTVSVP